MWGGGWLPPQNILSRHFEKYLHGIVLKLTEHVRNTISLLYKQKTGWNSDIWNFFWRKFKFAIYFPESRLFQVGHVWKRHCDVIRWPIFKICVSMERGDPPLYYDTTHLYFGHVNLKFMGRGNHPPPLRKMCYGKYLRKTRVKNLKSTNQTKVINRITIHVHARPCYIVHGETH